MVMNTLAFMQRMAALMPQSWLHLLERPVDR
jgi:hypothetical protein